MRLRPLHQPGWLAQTCTGIKRKLRDSTANSLFKRVWIGRHRLRLTGACGSDAASLRIRHASRATTHAHVLAAQMARGYSTRTLCKASQHRRRGHGNQHRNCKHELVHLTHYAYRFSCYVKRITWISGSKSDPPHIAQQSRQLSVYSRPEYEAITITVGLCCRLFGRNNLRHPDFPV
jgi:hypothetical protein